MMRSTAPGDDSRLTFLLLVSLRSHFVRQPLLTLLSALVVGLSVALVIALGLSSQSVERALSRSADALRGNADFEVTAGAVGMPEKLLEAISGLPGIAVAAPVIETTVRIAGGPGDGRALRILGVDLLADQSVRSYSVVQRGLQVLDPLRLVAKSDSLIVSEVLAKQLGIGDGDPLRVRTVSGERALRVRGLLAAGGMGDAYAGQIAVMDVYALQALLSRQGWLDRIDLVLAPDADPPAVRAQVAARVDGIATVRVPEPGNALAQAALSTLGFIARVIALVGVLVSGLLCYAALAASVDRRTRLFALLRAAGLETRRIHRLVHLDALVAGIAGILLGIPAGVWLSRGFAAVFSKTSSWLSGLEIEPAPVSWGVLGLGVAVGIGVSQASAALASRRSTRLAPHEALAGGRGLGLDWDSRPPRRVWVPCLLVLCAWLVVWQVPLPIGGTYRAAVLFALGLLLLWTSVAPLLALLLPLLGAAVERWMPGIGRVAAGSLLLRLNQTRIATASIAALIAVTSSLWILVVSLVDTMDRAVSTKGGTIVTAKSPLDSDPSDRLYRDQIRDATLRVVIDTSGVESVFCHYISEVIYRGEKILLSAITSDVLASRIGLPLTQRIGPDSEVVAGLQSGGVIVYDAFQRRFGVKLGDSIELDTPHGRRSFTILGTRPGYYTASTGGIQMDLATFDRYWTRPGLSNLIVWTRGARQDVLAEIERRAAGIQPLFFVLGEQRDRLARDTLARYSRPVYTLLGLVALLAGVAIAGLLVGASNERRGDMALLQCVGASRGQFSRFVLTEGLAVGTAGVVAGLALSVAFASSLGTVLAEEFGWVISWSLRTEELALLALATLAVSALIGLPVAARVHRATSWNSLASE
jgi:putative ABC transport system permease protein